MSQTAVFLKPRRFPRRGGGGRAGRQVQRPAFPAAPLLPAGRHPAEWGRWASPPGLVRLTKGDDGLVR